MKTLKIGVTYAFIQGYLPTKRHSIPRERQMVTCADITYKELDESEFPVAMIEEDHQSLCQGAKTPEEVHKGKTDYVLVKDELRTYEGKLYKARRISYGAACSTEYVSADDLVRISKENARYVYVSKADVPFNEEKSIVVYEDRNERAKAFQDAADNIIIFDGKVWDECQEPMYSILTFGLGHNHGGTGFFIEHHYNPNISAKNYFRADQRNEAIEYFKKTALGRGDTQSVNDYTLETNIRVLMPEVIKANPQKDHADGGDPFMESVESIISNSDSVAEAGLLAIALTAASVA